MTDHWDRCLDFEMARRAHWPLDHRAPRPSSNIMWNWCCLIDTTCLYHYFILFLQIICLSGHSFLNVIEGGTHSWFVSFSRNNSPIGSIVTSQSKIFYKVIEDYSSTSTLKGNKTHTFRQFQNKLRLLREEFNMNCFCYVFLAILTIVQPRSNGRLLLLQKWHKLSIDCWKKNV
jgi:hypothetical protein